MSGGGSSGGPASGPLNCDIVESDKVLQSPDASVLEKIKKGDRLRVTLRSSSPVAVSGKEVAGSIIYDGVERLIRCLREGHEYVAHVTFLNLKDDECRVTIRPA